MYWIRRYPWRFAAGAAATVGVIALLVSMYSSYTADSAAGTASAEKGTSDSAIDVPSDGTSALPKNVKVPTPTSTARSFGGSLVTGIPGSGSSNPAAKHAITLRVTSPSAIVFVKYYVPTAKLNGVDYPVGKSWSLSTTVQGPPDYAQLFLQANGNGDPITCTISVDGKVTDKRTTGGPYGQILCQG
ncbi:MAG: hypothetical protein JWQ70_2391 [Aeromicrobium sp.]|nr:hypothetical protein [Aeromicrobium sp.]